MFTEAEDDETRTPVGEEFQTCTDEEKCGLIWVVSHVEGPDDVSKEELKMMLKWLAERSIEIVDAEDGEHGEQNEN